MTSDKEYYESTLYNVYSVLHIKTFGYSVVAQCYSTDLQYHRRKEVCLIYG